jgi:hypothetical protein
MPGAAARRGKLGLESVRTGPGLERRVDPTATAAVAATIHAARDEAADHLRTHGPRPTATTPIRTRPTARRSRPSRPPRALSFYLTASTATLGTVRDHLRDAKARWELALPGKDGSPGNVDPLVAMLTCLWEGQRSRHGGHSQ